MDTISTKSASDDDELPWWQADVAPVVHFPWQTAEEVVGYVREIDTYIASALAALDARRVSGVRAA